MKRLIAGLLTITTLLLALNIVTARPVAAVPVIEEVCNSTTATGEAPAVCLDDSSKNTDDQNPVLGANGVVTKGIRIFLIIFGITALFVMLINAVRMITSQGDPSSTNSARNGLIFAVVGLVIAIAGQFIVSLIVSKFGK